jgi:uroporphyrinogen-III decarboxylase
MKGVLNDLSDMDRYDLPDYSRAEAYEAVREARAKAPDKWLVGELPGFAFGIGRKLRKLENYLLDLMIERERIHVLHDRIDDLLVRMIRCYAGAGVDCVMIWEDWGTQYQLMLDPLEWRKEFRPRFEKLCSAAHEGGIRVFMHSCGQIQAIVPDLIQSGIDVLQFDQPELHGVDALASYQERNKITFWCPVDIQKTLQLRDEEVIRAKAREMLNKLWRGCGGFIAGCYTDEASIDVDPRWQKYASDEFIRFGIRRRYDAAPKGAI